MHLPTLTLRDKWLQRAADRAGIDLSSWNPELGTIPNRDWVRRSYTYYASLFKAHPYLQWMGLANMISPTFGAAFDDLAVINAYLAGEPRPPWLGRSTESASLEAIRGASLAGVIPGRQDLRRLERTLLAMQKEIFVDQAVMHEAYLDQGLKGIEQLQRSGIIDDHAMQSWRLVDRGRRTSNQHLIDEGARGLLQREQLQIVADDYDQLREAGGGRMITFMLSLIGQPSIPGAKSAAKFSPIKVGPIRLPLPGIDISQRTERWAMAIGDTVPAFERLVREQPKLVAELIAKDTDTRIREEKLAHFRS